MSDLPFTQLGIGGVLAYLVLKEVFGFLLPILRGRNGTGTGTGTKSTSVTTAAGDYPAEYWQAQQRQAISEVLITVVVPILSSQTLILSKLEGLSVDMVSTMKVMMDRLERK